MWPQKRLQITDTEAVFGPVIAICSLFGTSAANATCTRGRGGSTSAHPTARPTARQAVMRHHPPQVAPEKLQITDTEAVFGPGHRNLQPFLHPS
jgi:hypothetical protein